MSRHVIKSLFPANGTRWRVLTKSHRQDRSHMGGFLLKRRGNRWALEERKEESGERESMAFIGAVAPV